MTINQWLTLGLILVLVAFLIILGKMAVEAVGLIKRSKVLVNNSNEAVEETRSKLNEIEDRALDAVSSIITDTSPAVKVVAGVGIERSLSDARPGAAADDLSPEDVQFPVSVPKADRERASGIQRAGGIPVQHGPRAGDAVADVEVEPVAVVAYDGGGVFDRHDRLPPEGQPGSQSDR